MEKEYEEYSLEELNEMKAKIESAINKCKQKEIDKMSAEIINAFRRFFDKGGKIVFQGFLTDECGSDDLVSTTTYQAYSPNFVVDSKNSTLYIDIGELTT